MLTSPQQRPPPSRLTCMGLGPAPFCTPPPARGLDLPPLTGQLLGSTALLDPGSLCLSVLGGAGRDCREPGCPPLSLKKGRLPRAGLRLALCVLGGDSSGRDEQDSMIFQSVCEKKLTFGGCKVLVSDVKNWWGGKFGCETNLLGLLSPWQGPQKVSPLPRVSTAAEQGEFHLGLAEKEHTPELCI